MNPQFALSLPPLAARARNPQVQWRHQEQSRYQRIGISRHPLFGGQLYLDGDLQISESDAAYGVAMVSPLMSLPAGARVAILGGGDGGVLFEALRHFRALARLPASLTMIEIDARVMQLSREHLPALCGDAFDDPAAEVIVGDAFAWLDTARDLDAVIYDLTMEPVREGQTRAQFIDHIMGRIARALKPGGIISMQCCGHGLSDADDRADRAVVLPKIRQALDRHFERRCEQSLFVPSYRDLWTFAWAQRRAVSTPHNTLC
ncbi:spermine synthase [Sinimarinibacterium sp. NLF-5-8]|uniref:spermine/spermidine synthase domain-containing protein n=1 Tax=Sinimarinibacterium sp. NLF-5-8 TaxID=2698684 RepID=UPI00137C39C1|nr:spermine synthase [Sinimarinibacterium sp. NLF-5-8]QHS09992.1 spermine synthase [Sinimarinibacterium sp. NLF-5-8]